MGTEAGSLSLMMKALKVEMCTTARESLQATPAPEVTATDSDDGSDGGLLAGLTKALQNMTIGSPNSKKGWEQLRASLTELEGGDASAAAAGTAALETSAAFKAEAESRVPRLAALFALARCVAHSSWKSEAAVVESAHQELEGLLQRRAFAGYEAVRDALCVAAATAGFGDGLLDKADPVVRAAHSEALMKKLPRGEECRRLLASVPLSDKVLENKWFVVQYIQENEHLTRSALARVILNTYGRVLTLYRVLRDDEPNPKEKGVCVKQGVSQKPPGFHIQSGTKSHTPSHWVSFTADEDVAKSWARKHGKRYVKVELPLTFVSSLLQDTVEVKKFESQATPLLSVMPEGTKTVKPKGTYLFPKMLDYRHAKTLVLPVKSNLVGEPVLCPWVGLGVQGENFCNSSAEILVGGLAEEAVIPAKFVTEVTQLRQSLMERISSMVWGSSDPS
eukprot:Rhum_TRINITY_DN14100_c0_g1::Rhum_TRINITY_DN14100_c0_g1_i2::g.69239::m.69239